VFQKDDLRSLGWGVFIAVQGHSTAAPLQHEEQTMSYDQFETTMRHLEICINIVNEAVDKGINFEKFKAKLVTEYERDSFVKLRAHCIRFIEIYDEMDTIP